MLQLVDKLPTSLLSNIPCRFLLVYALRGVTRALIGGCIFIYSCSARRISFEIKFISMNIIEYTRIYEYTPPPPPPINALVTPLYALTGSQNQNDVVNVSDTFTLMVEHTFIFHTDIFKLRKAYVH